jgi:hypothetical protein
MQLLCCCVFDIAIEAIVITTTAIVITATVEGSKVYFFQENIESFAYFLHLYQ